MKLNELKEAVEHAEKWLGKVDVEVYLVLEGGRLKLGKLEVNRVDRAGAFSLSEDGSEKGFLIFGASDGFGGFK